MNNENPYTNAPNGAPNTGYTSIPPIMQPPKAPRKDRIPAEGRDIAFAIALAVFSVLITNFTVWGGVGLGVTVTASVMLITTVAYLFKTRRHFSIYTVLAAVSHLALSISLTFSDSSFGKALAVFMMIVLYGVVVMDMTDTRRRRPGSFRAVSDFCNTAVVYPLDGMPQSIWAIFHRTDGEGKVSRRKTGGVIAGIACAIPVLCIILPLLISSDAAFQGLLRRLNITMSSEIIFSFIFGAMLFILLFSQAFYSSHKKPNEKLQRPSAGIIDPSAVCSFMCVVSAAYLLYLISQLAYFFNAFSGILQAGYTMAGYARRGFFEMCVICFINLLIVFVCSVISRKKEGKIAATVKYPALFICLFSLILIATALSKMVMYIDGYGMTHLRIFTSLFMVFLAVVFIAVALRLFIKNVPYMQISLIAAAIIIAASVFADIDRVVASYNINAYLDGRLDTIDINTISELDSDAAVPYLLKLKDCGNSDIEAGAKKLLVSYLRRYYTVISENGKLTLQEYSYDSGYDFRSYNIHSYRARNLLRDHWMEFYDDTTQYGYNRYEYDYEYDYVE